MASIPATSESVRGDAQLQGVLKYRLGKSGRKKPEQLNQSLETRGMVGYSNQGPTGNAPAVLQQYAFLKSSPFSHSNMKNPSTRAILNTIDRKTRDRLRGVMGTIADTHKQIRINAKTFSGTSRPKVSDFNRTTDFARLTQSVETRDLMKWLLGLLILYIILTKIAKII